MIQVDPLQGNAVLVDALGSALRRGGNALGSVPGLLKRILAEESWREFQTQRGEIVHHDLLDDFIEQPPLRGLGADVALVERVIKDDADAVVMLRKARKRRAGRKSATEDGRQSRHNIPRSNTGTSRAYALERLQRDAPELHAEVVAGRLSAHNAMVRAGFKPPQFTVRAITADAVVSTLRNKLPPEMLHQVILKLGP
jgi:hypothetical protein